MAAPWETTRYRHAFAGVGFDSVEVIQCHAKDADCAAHIDRETGCCTVCGVDHSERCPACGCTGFHADDCEEVNAR